jgi:hypothetical protein
MLFCSDYAARQQGRGTERRSFWRNRCRKALERAKGIEPSYAAWEAAVLPLNYARESTTSTLFVFRFDRHLERLILAVAGILYRDLDCNPATRANTVGHETEREAR